MVRRIRDLASRQASAIAVYAFLRDWSNRFALPKRGPFCGVEAARCEFGNPGGSETG